MVQIFHQKSPELCKIRSKKYSAHDCTLALFQPCHLWPVNRYTTLLTRLCEILG